MEVSQKKYIPSLQVPSSVAIDVFHGFLFRIGHVEAGSGKPTGDGDDHY